MITRQRRRFGFKAGAALLLWSFFVAQLRDELRGFSVHQVRRQAQATDVSEFRGVGAIRHGETITRGSVARCLGSNKLRRLIRVVGVHLVDRVLGCRILAR